MSKSKGSRRNANRILGTYSLQGGQAAVGELKLKGSSTLLKLHSDEYLQKVEDGAYLHGVAYNGHLEIYEICQPLITIKKMPFGIVAADHKCSSNTILSAN
jgi:hypothetical protein